MEAADRFVANDLSEAGESLLPGVHYLGSNHHRKSLSLEKRNVMQAIGTPRVSNLYRIVQLYLETQIRRRLGLVNNRNSSRTLLRIDKNGLPIEKVFSVEVQVLPGYALVSHLEVLKMPLFYRYQFLVRRSLDSSAIFA